MNLLKKLALHDTNRKGYSSKRKFVVIESDDWGSVRMTSAKSYDVLKKSGIQVEKSPYCRLDGLEKSEDLDNLMTVLSKHKDQQGNPACITLNYVAQNPNFNAIRNAEYRQYYGESIQSTFINTDGCDAMDDRIKQGLNGQLIVPQFHGREHVQVTRWLELLRSGRKDFKLAFDQGIWGLSSDVLSDLPYSIQATYDGLSDELAATSIREGLKLFREYFGFAPKTFIPNNYIWNPDWNSLLAQEGITHLQGMKYTLVSKKNPAEPRIKIRRAFGERNEFNQTYGIRNCHFEPSEQGTTVDDVLIEMSIAFMWNRPAIICSHRINFTSRMTESNRDNNLNKLDLLLAAMLKRWPDIEFVSSPQLANLFQDIDE